jgi:hypothetical protein
MDFSNLWGRETGLLSPATLRISFLRQDILRLPGYLEFEWFCSARLEAGTLESSACSPEGERYSAQPNVGSCVLRDLNARSKIF